MSNEPTAEAIIVTEPDRTLVPASDLPPAADVLESLFAEDHPSAEGTIAEGTVAEDAATPEESNLADDTPTDTPSISFLIANDIQEDAAVEHAAISQALESFAESQPSSSSPEISTDLVDRDEPSTEPREESQADLFSADEASAEANADESAVEVLAEAESHALDSSDPAESPAETLDAPLLDSTTEASQEWAGSSDIAENLAESPSDSDDSDTSERVELTPSSDWAFEEKLASHREWLDSQGAAGKKANWANVNLEDHELIGISLRFADLHAANLKGADLLLADLRDTCLVRANLQEACLVGANLEGANLEGASLATSLGLVARQLAGTNLHDASLPEEVTEFGALAEFERACKSAYQFFVALMTVSVLSALVIWRTKDARLITDSGLINIPHFPAAAAALPAEEIYLIAPVLLFILYFTFHFHLQRLWNAALELPAVFPDGRALGQSAPRIIAGLLGAHFRWMNRDGAGALPVEKIISLLLAYGVAPAMLLLYWARYLTLQDFHGTTLHALLAAGAVGITLYVMTRVGRPQEKWAIEEKPVRRFTDKLKTINFAILTGGFCVFLLLLSVGTIKGIPREKSLAPQFMSFDVRRWAPSFLSVFGLDPWARLPEAVMSTPPENWSGSDDQISPVQGAQLNGRSLRYAEAYGIFLANAHLFRSDFQGAFMSEADLRGADLSQSSLRLADLDRARMSHSNLNRADLTGANLARADLRNADLSYASLGNASMVDAQLGSASFYGARLPFASLVRANLEKSDLRGANLEGADLEHADVQQAYLWSAKLPDAHLRNAQLQGAILIGADLQGADLGEAQLMGTVLNEANLKNANLAGADLRGSLGLTANQVCSAKYRQGALLDDAMQTQVDAQCGAR